MSAYKDSGIKWLGKIPAHWEVVKGGYLFLHKKEINSDLQCEDRLSLTLNGVIDRDINANDGLNPSDFRTYQIFEKDNLVFKLLDLDNIKTSRVGLVHKKGIMSSAYIRLIAKDCNINMKYFYYQYYNMYLKNIFNALGTGVRATLNYNELLNIEILNPPLKEQRKIADFLDKKLEKIDYFIAKQTKFIELLKEQKQVLINQATTKGLDKSTELKDTHIPHLGKIPTHWEVVKMSFLGSFGKGGKLSRADLTEDGEFSAVLYGDIYTQYNFKIEYCKSRISKDKAEIKADKGDLFFTASGETREDIGKCVAFISDEETYIGGDIIVFKPIDVDSMYLSYFLNNDYSKLIKAIYSKGEIIIHIHQETLKNISIALPPLEEQEKIAKYLDDKCDKIDKAINNITKQISLIQEYKTSLIDTATKGMLKELK